MDNKTTEMGTPKLSIIEEGTELRGALSSGFPLLVRGAVHGEVTCPALSVAPQGSVSGQVRAGLIESTGSVAGELEAEVVRLSGKVGDDTVVRARSLEVRLASDDAMVLRFGEARLEVGEAPATPEKR